MGEIHSFPEMIARKMAVDLRATAAAATQVNPADGISFTKDHEQAQPKAVKNLADTTVASSFHCIIIQLPPRHVLPLVLERRQVKAGDAGAEGNRRERSSRVPGSTRLVARLDAEVAKGPEAPVTQVSQPAAPVSTLTLSEPVGLTVSKRVSWQLQKPQKLAKANASLG